jgi:hypothetical protein
MNDTLPTIERLYAENNQNVSENTRVVLTSRSPISEILDFAKTMLHGVVEDDIEYTYRIEGDVNE